MINIENSAKLNNSISYNVINDDLVAKNYLAFAYCIAGIKSKIAYLNGIRCYDFTCPKRIRINPDKKEE